MKQKLATSIPKIPLFPKKPSMPTIPGNGIPSAPGGNSQGTPGPGGGGMPDFIAGFFSGKKGGPGGFSLEKMKKMAESFDLDKYRDENGAVQCPIPKETREKMAAHIFGPKSK